MIDHYIICFILMARQRPTGVFSTVSDLVCGDVSYAEFAGDVELVFGTDDEKAMVWEHCVRFFQVSSMCFVVDIGRRMSAGS